MNKSFFSLLFLTFFLAGSYSQKPVTMQPDEFTPMLQSAPMIGAEIFIEPGQTAEEIDSWFRLMKESGMSICRIRMFETYMHRRGWHMGFFPV